MSKRRIISSMWMCLLAITFTTIGGVQPLQASDHAPIAARVETLCAAGSIASLTTGDSLQLSANLTSDVPDDWWSQALDQILVSEYYITWQEQTYLSDVSTAYQAPNRAHNLRTYFTPEGPIVIPRHWTGQDPNPPWRWEVRLVAWGREGALKPAFTAALDVEENLIKYQRGDPSAGVGLRLDRVVPER